ncbi:hypothetical protein C7N43_27065 [Sphingobacteriales bacterium UPWRP_1]|nr:hypothetical protein BVG80_15700 [Sphingobacteriales bacterium TSM_CSM]PSJ73844.1 hypothetical protein C7N43_27065 [Sphingobacteriales bacterium UPWRP_1]
MCDTFAALPDHTAGGCVVLGKNSDREPNEAQVVERIPAREQTEKTVKCTYIAIPQVARTNEVILCRPFWMWGAEMGVNEHGVAIGNEAVFTKIPAGRTNTGLTGMDLLRLSLERSNTAQNALQCISQLLEQYGQDGCGGYKNKRFFYHNSFLIADTREVWVLETAARHWVAQQITHGFRSISNGLTIEEQFDLHSNGLQDYARRQQLTGQGETLNFRKAFSDRFYTYMSSCGIRQPQSATQGGNHPGSFLPQDAMQILSSHYTTPFNPARATTQSICMHATGLTNPSQTVGSMVAVLRSGKPHTVWVTGTSMPCLSVYKPLFFAGNPLSGAWSILPGATPNHSLWWQAEMLHRNAIHHYKEFLKQYDAPRLRLQNALIGNENLLLSGKFDTRNAETLSEQAAQQHLQLIARFLPEALKRGKHQPFHQIWHRLYWKIQNQAAKINRPGGAG